jgi:hypothetical protein
MVGATTHRTTHRTAHRDEVITTNSRSYSLFKSRSHSRPHIGRSSRRDFSLNPLVHSRCNSRSYSRRRLEPLIATGKQGRLHGSLSVAMRKSSLMAR